MCVPAAAAFVRSRIAYNQRKLEGEREGSPEERQK